MEKEKGERIEVTLMSWSSLDNCYKNRDSKRKRDRLCRFFVVISIGQKPGWKT